MACSNHEKAFRDDIKYGIKMEPGKANLLFTMTGACSISGGIATLNLNILRVLIGIAQDRGSGLTIFSFLEKDTSRPDFLPDWVDFKGFQGNKLALSANLLQFALKRPICCFDHVTLTLPVLPLAAAGVVKTIIFAHGSESWKRLRRMSRWSFQSASLCLTNSHYTLKKMRERIPKFNGKGCPLGLSPEFPLNRGIPGTLVNSVELQAADGKIHTLGNRVLLLVARMHPAERQKGHYALLMALPTLLEEYPDIQLVFPGPGDDRTNLERLAQGMGVAASVFLPGHVSVQILQRLYQHCYAYVMPSKQEGFGLAYLEAMNYGKPCVGCFDDGAEEVIMHGETGLLVRDPNAPDQLLEVLRALLRDPERAWAMGKKGFERLHCYFTSQHVQERIKQHIASVLG